jgi:hypothetical protein
MDARTTPPTLDECVFVVPGGLASPVLELAAPDHELGEGAFDMVAVLVVQNVEGDGSPAGGALVRAIAGPSRGTWSSASSCGNTVEAPA